MSAQIKPTTASELVPVTVENLPGPRAIFFSLASWRGGVLRSAEASPPVPVGRERRSRAQLSKRQP